MASRKTVFVIPGYKQLPTNKAYKAIAKILRSEGYRPILVTIPWKQSTISENTEYFLKRYKKVSMRKKYILGFSFGAMIALLASTKVNTSGLILCSLSPYFREDLAKIRNIWLSAATKKRYDDFSQMQCAEITKLVKTRKILMLYGALEERVLIKRVNQAFSQIAAKQKYLLPIRQTQHNIGDKRYLRTIHHVAKELL